MKFFLDTASLDDVKELAATGLVDGITTNPSLIAASGRKFTEVLKEMCTLIGGPVSAEVTALDEATMIKEGLLLAKIAENIVIKVPLTPDGLKACRALRLEGIMVNVTLCFSAAQALLAAKSGATYISPFIGRLDDISEIGMGLIEQIVQIYKNYSFKTQVLASSIRHPAHIVEAALLGADVATMPNSVFQMLVKHPLTDRGLEKFLADWKKASPAPSSNTVAGAAVGPTAPLYS